VHYEKLALWQVTYIYYYYSAFTVSSTEGLTATCAKAGAHVAVRPSVLNTVKAE